MSMQRKPKDKDMKGYLPRRKINLSDDSSDEGEQLVISQPLLAEDAHILSSNQQVAEAATNHPQFSDDEFDDDGLLTKFIGPGSSTV